MKTKCSWQKCSQEKSENTFQPVYYAAVALLLNSVEVVMQRLI